jgi:PPM family protein phosphatase
MLTVIEAASASDTGQVRRMNEDAYLVSPPVFVVADGMGGARAGEVASHLCIETFSQPDADHQPPEQALRHTIDRANRRIHERAMSDAATAGMGTTVTAALVTDERITFGHVGDSRAYLYRGGALQQLSDDHSLVGELVRRGAITQDEAEQHPQRSIITRALGTEQDVESDTFSVEARDDDVILLCSDGLSGMVRDDAIARILHDAASLAAAAAALIRAANAAGGEDNITVVLFRIGEADTPLTTTQASTQTTSPNRAAPPAATRTAADTSRPGRGVTRRVATWMAVAASVVLLAAAGGWFLSWAHFVGATPDGRVGVYQGLPFDLVGSLRLYRLDYETTIPVGALSTAERVRLFDHTLGSRTATLARVAALPATAYWRVR